MKKRELITLWSWETDAQRHALMRRVNDMYNAWRGALGTTSEHIALPVVRGGTPLERLMYALDDLNKHKDRRLDIEGDEIDVCVDHQEAFVAWAKDKGVL